MEIEYRIGESALPAEAFVALAQRVWPRSYDTAKIAAALTRTINIRAWAGNQLVGSVRVHCPTPCAPVTAFELQV